MNNTQNDQLIAITNAFNTALQAIVNPQPLPTACIPTGEAFVEKPGTKKKYNVTEANAITGYKGFKLCPATNKPKCIDVVFDFNKVHSVKPPVTLCSNGFHFCKKLNEVNSHYRLSDPEFVFYKVKAWGEIDEIVGDKLCAEHIQIGEAVAPQELWEANFAERMDMVDRLTALNPNLVISGSLALILLGILPYRECGDYDFTLPTFQMIGEKSEVSNKFGKSGNECIQMDITVDKPTKYNGTEKVTIDLFINPKTIFNFVTFKGKQYKVSDPKVIIEAKLRYFMEGKRKHAKDLAIIMNNYDGKNSCAIVDYTEYLNITHDSIFKEDKPEVTTGDPFTSIEDTSGQWGSLELKQVGRGRKSSAGKKKKLHTIEKFKILNFNDNDYGYHSDDDDWSL